MASTTGDVFASAAESFRRLSSTQKIIAMLVLAAMLVFFTGGDWAAKFQDYKVLYSNLDDRDGGQVIDALQKMNIPYKMADGGAIMVAADKVYETRLKLGAEGLPKGGSVGFELLDNEKMGTSQFVEQINYQRGLEGELARSIESLAAVSGARVHLAIAKQSVFLRDQEKARASVLVKLYPGRVLESSQVAGIVHLVSSSVPHLGAEQVSVVDQSGRLLTRPNAGQDVAGLSANQLDYVSQMEKQYAKRIMDILTPLVGPDGVRAEVSADVDFSQTEQSSEKYTPNPASVRSEQKVADQSSSSGVGGIPGALSNQPPTASTAPFIASAAAPVAAASLPGNSRSESVVNYEIDRTISHTKQQVGTIKRLSVAVVVDHRAVPGKGGKVSYQALRPAEISQINNLVRDTIGFDLKRGDSVNVVNMPFRLENVSAAVADEPWWQQAWIQSLAKYVVLLVLGLMFFFGALQPFLKNTIRIAERRQKMEAERTIALAEAKLAAPTGTAAASALLSSGYDNNLQTAKQLVVQDPKRAAQVIREWLAHDG